jgi:hypothetical protein
MGEWRIGQQGEKDISGCGIVGFYPRLSRPRRDRAFSRLSRKLKQRGVRVE